MITGIWHGKINGSKVELKLIQSGDSLRGTCYYYRSPAHYRRYSVKGYIDATDNSVVWWDDELIAHNDGGMNSSESGEPSESRADFNCPGGGVMKLDGRTYRPRQAMPAGEVHLDKIAESSFADEWDYVLENYTTGANDPETIDSVSLVAKTSVANQPKTNEQVTDLPGVDVKRPSNKNIDPKEKKSENLPLVAHEDELKPKAEPISIQQKFERREKIFQKEIPLSGDSIELRFYDNAEVDGDSISLFLNGRLIFEHIALTEKAYVVKLAVKDLPETNELIMVAENLGSIPPNTSYMVAIVGNNRYDAQLASTENSSAMIRLKKAASY